MFHVPYAAVDRELPELLAQHRPQAMFMFGLAATQYVRDRDPRPQCRHHRSSPTPTAALARKGSIVDGGAPDVRPAHGKSAARGERRRHRARASRNAGSYVCNYLAGARSKATAATAALASPRSSTCRCWRATAHRRARARLRITLEELVDAGEAMLMELVKLAHGQAERAPAQTYASATVRANV